MKKLLKEWRKFLNEEETDEPKETDEQKLERKLKRLLVTPDGGQGQFLALYDQLSDKPVEYFVQGMKFEDLLYIVVEPDAKAEILSAVYKLALPESAHKMMRRSKQHLRNRIGQNANTPMEILEHLMNDYDARHGITMNPNATPEMLDKLAEADYTHHGNIIKHPNTSLETLKFISEENTGFQPFSHRNSLKEDANIEIEDRLAAAKKQKNP